MRYRATMTKTPRKKLILRNQTIRVLTHMELAHAVGGSDPGLAGSGAKACSTETGAVATQTCH